MQPLALLLCWPLLLSDTAPPASPAPAPLPDLAAFARTPAISGSESVFAAEIAALLPAGWRVERDAFGSLIVRAGAAPGSGAAPEPVRRLIAVGIDEPGYVVSQIRDDGWLRLHAVGRGASPTFHLAHEGRPVWVQARGGDVPGVITVNSVHFRTTRPDVLGEEHLYLDVGADNPTDVAALGIELLDPVAMREIVTLQDGRVAGPSLGTRAADLALLTVLRDLPPAAGGGLAFAFVAQAETGTGPLGRGGEGAARRLQPTEVLVLRASGSAQAAAPAPTALTAGPKGWSALELHVGNAGSAVETVAPPDLQAFSAALAAEVRQ